MLQPLLLLALTLLHPAWAASPSKTKYNLDLSGTGGRILNEDPLVVEYDDFFSKDECEHFLSKVKPRLKLPGGAGTPDNARFTSALSHNQDKTVWCMTQRVSSLVGVSSENAERLRVVRYLPDTMDNGPHYDARHHIREASMIEEKKGGQRLITALWYLDDVEGGGATEFTNLGLKVMPKQGKLLIFHNTFPHSIIRHPSALHHGMRVTAGEKHLVTWWFRDLPIMSYDAAKENAKFGACTDHDVPGGASLATDTPTPTPTSTPTKVHATSKQLQCESKIPTFRSKQSSFKPKHDIPPLLWSAPGSGNTWVRLLIEQATGVLSGSLYTDHHLEKFLLGNDRCMDDTIVVKAHPMHCGTTCMRDISTSKIAFKKCGPELQAAGHDVTDFGNNAVILIREPFKAIWSDFQRSVNLNAKTDHHLMKVNRTSFLGNEFFWKKCVRSCCPFCAVADLIY